MRLIRNPRSIAAACCLLLAASAAAADLVILPQTIALDGAEALQRVTVNHVDAEGRIGALADPGRLELEIGNPDIATLRDGVLHAVADGETELQATLRDAGGKSVAEASVAVHVSGTGKQVEWSFRNDVQSILARRGCSLGACHGALAGKGGFRLSLRGYDVEADYHTIAREARGRRIEVSDPGRSLILAKPTGALPHKGGLRLDEESRDYQILSQWIAAGAAPPAGEDPQLVRISVAPEQARLAAGDNQQILVSAHYSDGRIEDVTHWAKFTSTDEAVAGVDDEGAVTVRGSGEGAIQVWFGSKIALARMTVPYPNRVDSHVYADARRRNFIDDLVLDKLQQLNLPPSPPADDATFVRRAFLDTIGTLPTAEETDQYVNSTSRDKRDQLIDQLLNRPEFVDYWTYRWSDVLLINGTRLRPAAVKAYYEWVRGQVQQNVPWDEFVHKILTARGSSVENGATNFYALHQDPESMTENASQAFLGLSLACAKCHNHPLEKWTNDQYYAMANHFARVRAKGWGGDGRNGDGIRTLYVATTGDLIQPNRGVAQPPTPLDGEPLDLDDPSDRREHLAGWMTSPDNPYFARAITNRIWQNFYGVGLVEQVDDLRLSNPASNEPLLEAAAAYLVDSGFDLKQLMRVILQSETYSRSSEPLPENAADSRFYSRYFPRRLMAEVLLDAVDTVLETHTAFDQIAFPGADTQKTDFYPPGTRAIQLYDAAVDSYFLKTFGRNPREITCECERTDEPSMVQVLHLSNGETLNPKLADEENRIARWLESDTSTDAVIENLFQTALARQPTAEEKQRLSGVIEEYGRENRRQALEDVAWSVLTSTEFVFNH